MEQDYPDLAKLPETLKHLQWALDPLQIETLRDGVPRVGERGRRFHARPGRDARTVGELRETFPGAAWEGNRITVTGEPARKFMALYRRAAGVPSLGNWIMEKR